MGNHNREVVVGGRIEHRHEAFLFKSSLVSDREEHSMANVTMEDCNRLMRHEMEG